MTAAKGANVKRLVICSILSAALLGCDPGGSESNPTPVGQTGQPTPTSPVNIAIEGANAVDGDPPHRNNLIVMTANDNHDTTVTAACVGTATTYRMRQVKRKHKLRWHIQNDLYNPCPFLNFADVELRFDDPIMADGVQESEAALDVLKPKPGKTYIDGRVHADQMKAPNKIDHKYLVYYKGLKASPDPEIDIDGACGGCGPGGGS